MATLTDDEMNRIKAELGVHVLGTGAETYLGYRAIFNIIKSNVSSSTVTPKTCSTTVTAAGAVQLTLSDVTDLFAHQRIHIDVDGQREVCSIKAVSGSTVYVNCTKTHSGVYPIDVESALTQVRDVMADLTSIEQGKFKDLTDIAWLKQVDDVIFQDNPVKAAQAMRDMFRLKLADLVGLGKEFRGHYGSGPGSYEMY